jgi:predicted Zn-dependent peptidase
LWKDGIGAEDLAKEKAAYKAGFNTRLTNDQYVVGALNRSLYVGRTLEFQKQLNEAIDRLTPADLAAAVQKGYVTEAGLVKIVAGDMKKAAAGAPAPPAQ